MIDGEICMDGLKEKSVQGDSAVLDIARRMGCDIAFDGSALVCRHAKLRGTVIDASDIPDLIPALGRGGGNGRRADAYNKCRPAEVKMR